jgi:hypothetical protein
VLVVGLLALAPACRSGQEFAVPTTTTTAASPLLLAGDAPVTLPPSLPLPPGYELSDTRDVQLRAVTGQGRPGPPAPAVAMGGGSSRLTGVVRGPDGPVGGATVRIERFVEERVGRLDVVAAADGSFGAAGLPGGRYRVRAWSRPLSVTVVHPALVFLAADAGAAAVEIEAERHNATTMLGTVGASRWQVGQRTGVSVLVSQEYVDGAGVVRVGGVPGAPINLQVPPGLTLVSEASETTGDDGYARFGVECVVPGQYTLVAESSGFTRPIPVPLCSPPPPPPTVAPSVSPFDVGRVFDTPTAGPLPPGTYTSLNADAPTRCLTQFEVLTAGEWRRDAASAVIQAAGPVRSLQPGLGSAPCTYRRTA